MQTIDVKNLRMKKSDIGGYVILSAVDWDVLTTYVNRLEKLNILRRLWQKIRKTAIYNIRPIIARLDEWPKQLTYNELQDLTTSQYRKLRETNPELLGLHPGKQYSKTY